MTFSLSQTAQEDLRELIRAAKPESLLLAGAARDYIELVSTEADGSKIEQADLDRLRTDINELPIFDVILLADVLERLDKQDAEVLIGRLRDLHSRHLFLFIRIGEDWDGLKSYWQRTDLLAHGFTLHQRYEYGDGALEYDLCRFDLETYKQTPDWLNSQYWANPELWGKYRW